jgi:citrate lyase beta subunit
MPVPSDSPTAQAGTDSVDRGTEGLAELLDRRLAEADEALARGYPGDPGTRQPVHTVYVPADRFTADLPAEWGRAALALLDAHAPTAPDVAAATGLPSAVVADVHDRVRSKLVREPVEDLRIDFEDGYGLRSDEEEDRTAREAVRGVVDLVEAEDRPPFLGIRFKSFEAPTRRRGLRTLQVVLGGLMDAGGLPDGFLLTLPKVTSVDQVAAMVEVSERLEAAHGLPPGRLRFEIQVETPQAILGADGTATVARMLRAAPGRITGLHYGTYDYSAACGVSAAYQSMEHPVADHAKAVMQVAAAGTGVRVADGSTNILPVGDGAAVRSAWRLHARLVRRSLERAFYQGWDMHPGHLVTRFAATYAFYREGFPAAADRLRAYFGSADSGVLDEPATAQAMASLLLRGLQCGALDEAEVTERSGVERAVLDRHYRRRVG